jgi:hypothetical protein
MTQSYPPVYGELATLDAILAGKSIARFGDGELKLIDGAGYVRQSASPKLAAELRSILHSPHENCLAAIPTLDPNGPKYFNWLRHRDRFARVLDSGRAPIPYYSAFVTRPDSAPWIYTVSFARRFEQVWRGKTVAVLSEAGNSIVDVALPAARKLKLICCPSREAYDEIDVLEKAVVRAKPEVALLSCGPTATCLANRLSARGIHAVDIGSAGGYLRKLLTRGH